MGINVIEHKEKGEKEKKEGKKKENVRKADWISIKRREVEDYVIIERKGYRVAGKGKEEKELRENGEEREKEKRNRRRENGKNRWLSIARRGAGGEKRYSREEERALMRIEDLRKRERKGREKRFRR
jgi:hypothetical protein